jgi:hypothetical protein
MIEITRLPTPPGEITGAGKYEAFTLAVQALPLLGETFTDDTALVKRVHDLALSFAGSLFNDGEIWTVKE